MEKSELDWVALGLLPHVGGKTMRALLAHFDSDLSAILTADEEALREVPGVGPVIAQNIQQIDLPQVERYVADWQKAGVSIFIRRNSAYPARLLELSDEPPTLFVRGMWDSAFWDKTIAIVGTRNPSPQSLNRAYRLGAHMAGDGYTVVSGLALGIDGSAHRGALSTPGGQTVAVLGSGVLNVYPPENVLLAQSIVQRGALVCEVSPDSVVSTPGLVARNRIISGMSEAVIVVETEIDGGAMRAARRSLELGRKVYTLDTGASGNRALIQEGAIVVGNVDGFALRGMDE